MSREIQEIMDKQEQNTTVIHLKDIMESLGVTLEKAMDILKIATSERSTYAGLINQN